MKRLALLGLLGLGAWAVWVEWRARRSVRELHVALGRPSPLPPLMDPRDRYWRDDPLPRARLFGSRVP